MELGGVYGKGSLPRDCSRTMWAFVLATYIKYDIELPGQHSQSASGVGSSEIRLTRWMYYS